MIEEPPILTVLDAAKRPRPDHALLAPFENVPTGNVCDAMDGSGALDPAIKPLEGLPERVVGPALTVDCGPRDLLALVGALSEIEPGDVLVVATGGWRQSAVIGDLVTGMAKNSGAVAVVTDGVVRDIAGLREVGLPIYTTGVSPNSPFVNGPGQIGVPVVIGGRQVASGDLVVGDADGIVTVPRSEVAAVGARLETVKSLEAELEAKVKAGLKIQPEIVELMQSARVKRI